MAGWTDLILIAGRLSLNLSNGMLRYLCLDGSEVIRGVYFAVRDKNWNTIPEEVVSVDTDIGENFFSINYRTRYANVRENIEFTVQGRIAGSKDSVIKWEFDGLAQSAFKRNRIGFCVLHPASAAGKPCRIVHGDGASEESVFPTLISPHQPFMNIKSIAYGGVISEFEGDVFEMEDQRNWTDASYKTYCTPLGLPFPVELAQGDSVKQSVTFRVGDQGQAQFVEAAGSQSARCRISGRTKSAHKLLDMWWMYAGKLSDKELKLLKNLPDGHIRLDIRPGTPQDFIANAVTDAEKAGKSLVPFLHLDVDTPDSFYLNAIQGLKFNEVAFLGQKGLKVVPTERIDPLAKVLRGRFKDITIAAGTDAFFAELNRNRLEPHKADAFVFSVNPQVHAFDNLSIVETLEGQAAAVETALDIFGGKPPWISPVTLRMRWNPNATGEEVIAEGELPADVDPRQITPFCACWTLAAIGLMSKAGAARATFFELAGWKGLFEKENGSEIPLKFPSTPSQIFPVYDVFVLLRGFEGGTVTLRETDNPLAACAYRITRGQKTIDILINLSENENQFEFKANPFSGKDAILFDWKDGGESGRKTGPTKRIRPEGDAIILPGYTVLTRVNTNNSNGGEL
jgi:hypothetical protein